MELVSEDEVMRAMSGSQLWSTSAPRAGQSLVSEELRSTSAPVYVGDAMGPSVVTVGGSAGSLGASLSLNQPDLLTTWLN